MKIFNFPGKVVVNIDYFQSQLRNAGYIGAVGMYCETTPGMTVCVDDSSPDPTNYVNAYVDLPLIVAVGAIGTANGSDQVTVAIQMFDPNTKQKTSWNGSINVTQTFPSAPPVAVPIVNGVGSFVVGPASSPMTFMFLLQIGNIATSRAGVQVQFQ